MKYKFHCYLQISLLLCVTDIPYLLSWTTYLMLFVFSFSAICNIFLSVIYDCMGCGVSDRVYHECLVRTTSSRCARCAHCKDGWLPGQPHTISNVTPSRILFLWSIFIHIYYTYLFINWIKYYNKFIEHEVNDLVFS